MEIRSDPWFSKRAVAIRFWPLFGLLLVPHWCSADEVFTDRPPETTLVTTLPPLGPEWIRLGKEDKCWLNRKQRQVAIDGEVCLQRGYLEMFACIKNTKEHESVVGLDSRAFLIHTALLAVGAKNGSPARYRPEYKPATGTTVDVFLEWIGDNGKRKRVKAQQWVRDLRTRKPMQHDWVFGGSSIWEDPESKTRYYRAEGGEVICVSNFPTAMMDLPIESSQANDELLFEALTENIPPRRTPVRVYLVPRLKSTEQGKQVR